MGVDIYGKHFICKNQMKFEDLKNGQVFCFVDDISEDSSEIKIYMRGGHTTTDGTAMDLETGIMYSFDEKSYVKILDVTLNIRSVIC